RENRQKFYVLQSAYGETNALISHPGLPKKFSAYPGDIDILIRYGLLFGRYEQGGLEFDVSPTGFTYYEQVKKQNQQPVGKIEKSIKSYIESNSFQAKYSSAYEKWANAEELLWQADSIRQLTTIGHLCREAIQEFASTLITYYRLTNVDENKAHDVNRIRSVLDNQSSNLGETEKIFLDALLEYWKTVSSLVQRQEHGAQREKENLIWEDGRRVVFQTLLVMYEVDKALSRGNST
ncbi:MAG: hypothetical protein JRI94_18955, partial [Deltaproteobacteria bacterium]|nr:hypothetical protein [Deltaproteobacteria bacterium]